MPSHICKCATPTGTVLLDLKRNRYFGLGAQETHALSCLVNGWSNERGQRPAEPILQAARALTQDMAKAGLLSPEPPHAHALPCTTVDLTGTLTSVGQELSRTASITPRHAAGFLLACLWARRALRSRSLYSVASELAECKARRAADAAFSLKRATELVGIFRRLQSYTFAADQQCLFQALSLTKFLFGNGLFPTWVIGVQTVPWSAHSWVQHEHLLLDARPEQVWDFTPILSV